MSDSPLSPTTLRHAIELDSVTVPINATLEQALHLRGSLLACTCLSCYELADHITDEISRALLASDAPSPALARAEQAVANDRLNIRRGIATHYFMLASLARIGTQSQFAHLAKLAEEVIPAIEDISGPLSEFKQRVEELAASHLAVMDAGQHD